MTKGGIAIFVLFFYLHTSAQSPSYTLSLYYAINEVQSPRHALQLDSAALSMQGHEVEAMIIGHADFLSGTDYNQQLSEHRARVVKEYLATTWKDLKILKCDGQGENGSTDNGMKDGEPSIRRVDVIFKVGPMRRKFQGPPRTTDQPQKAMPVVQDSTIVKAFEHLKKSDKLELEGLLFQPGRHVFMHEALVVLKNLEAALKAHPEIHIEIQGHVCCVPVEMGDGIDIDTHRRDLSVARAKAVYDYLVANGINPARLTYKGFGHSQPAVEPEMSAADEQANRRVEIMITSGD